MIYEAIERVRVGTGPRERPETKKETIIKGDPNLPAFYNVREKFPQCKAPVYDQGLCGACWAFAGAGILGDRLCIQSNGRINVPLSPQDIVNCAFENYGCGGGYMIPAADFLSSEGVAPASCFPYMEETDSCTFECQNASEKF